MSAGPRGSSIQGRLARWGFTDVAAAEAALTRLGLLDDDAGQEVVEALAGTADPALALTGLGRLVEAVQHPGTAPSASVEPGMEPGVEAGADAGDARELLARVRAGGGLRDRLFAVLGASAGLAEFLARHPGHWRVLADDAATQQRPSALGLRAVLLAAVGADSAPGPGEAPVARDDSARTLDQLRIAYRRQQLLLAARDLTGTVAVEDVAGELADLASAALEAGLAIARAGRQAPADRIRLAVVAMGKCGARELNYASDVDVVFVAASTGGADELAALAAATRLAEGVVRACGEVTAEGQLFPVDVGLRPEGRAGPLVRTLASHLAYYQRWARTWEFQALLKARPVAGDLELGRAYRDAVAPLVWEASAREHFVADVQAMRRRVERSVPSRELGRQLKLGPGGLRDVEFAVQLLQLVHGRADERLRVADTLTALQVLTDGGYVGRADGGELAAAYRWLRAVEHRLQLQRLRRTHTLPVEPAARRWLARSLGYPSSEPFDADYQRWSGEVRRLHEKLFYRPLLSATARLPTEELRLAPEAAAGRLAALGFADTTAAWRHLEALTTGVSRRAAIQRALLPVLLAEFADAADPDASLLAFRQVSEALGDTPWYLRVLRDAGATAQRLGRVLAVSRYATDLLARAPEAIALLGEDADLRPRPAAALEAELGAVAARGEGDWEGRVAVARALRRAELLRISAADVLGLLDVHQVGRALTDVAVVAVQTALTIAQNKIETELRGPLPVRIAILAMGRFGGGELGYGSDADVLIVHEPVTGPSGDLELVATPPPGGASHLPGGGVAAVASAVVEETRRLLALPAPDPPLLLDTGLRPEGRQGPLTRSLASYAAYYARWSRPWEAQALLRAAPCAGDREVADRFLADIADPVRYPAELPVASVVEIRRLKRRMERERVKRVSRARHLKLGPGGLSDVEWVAQLLTLRHARRYPALRVTGTVAALRAAVACGVLEPADAATLERAWSLAAAARNAIVQVTGRPGELLPGPGRELDGVARLLGYPPGEPGAALDAERTHWAALARRVVERILYDGSEEHQ